MNKVDIAVVTPTGMRFDIGYLLFVDGVWRFVIQLSSSFKDAFGSKDIDIDEHGDQIVIPREYFGDAAEILLLSNVISKNRDTEERNNLEAWFGDGLGQIDSITVNFAKIVTGFDMNPVTMEAQDFFLTVNDERLDEMLHLIESRAHEGESKDDSGVVLPEGGSGSVSELREAPQNKHNDPLLYDDEGNVWR